MRGGGDLVDLPVKPPIAFNVTQNGGGAAWHLRDSPLTVTINQPTGIFSWRISAMVAVCVPLMVLLPTLSLRGRRHPSLPPGCGTGVYCIGGIASAAYQTAKMCIKREFFVCRLPLDSVLRSCSALNPQGDRKGRPYTS